MQRIAANCYLPTNALLLKLIRKHPGIRIAFSISGITVDQLEEFAPEALDSFRSLANTGAVDFLTETYHHSLACMIPGNEFEFQVAKHQKKILTHFGVMSKVFRNTELIHSEQTAGRIQRLGFKGVMIDGVEKVLHHNHPNQIFEHANAPGLKLLTRNYRMSDDISFRFSQHFSADNAEKYVGWLRALPAQEAVINLAMDYETFGEHQKDETGIFSFLENLLTQLAASEDFRFLTPSEAVDTLPSRERLTVPGFISWADHERDLSAWLGNEMQRDAFDSLLKLETDIKALHNRTLLNEWRMLQTSDHFYYMSTKKGTDGDVHHYFSPYPSPYEAFINYMNVLTDFALKVKINKSAAVLETKMEDTRVSPEVLAMLKPAS
jgi:alpha-amylase